MILFKRFVPFLSAVLEAVLLEVWMAHPGWLWYVGAIALVINFLAIWLLAKSIFWRWQFWDFFINPGMFIASAVVFLALIYNNIVGHIFIAAAAIGYYIMLHNLFVFQYQSKKYQPYALESIYSYLNITSFFLLTVSSYGFYVFFGWPTWLLAIAIFILGGFLFYRTLSAHKITWRLQWQVVVLVAFLVVQAYYAVSFLPSSFMFNGLLVAIVYYLLTNVARDYLIGSVDIRATKRYITISIIIIVAAFLTARFY
jgi:hypothetical protein